MTKDEVLADLRKLIEAADKTFTGRIGITAAQARAIHNYIATVVPDEPTEHRWEPSPTQDDKKWCPKCGCPKDSDAAKAPCKPVNRPAGHE